MSTKIVSHYYYTLLLSLTFYLLSSFLPYLLILLGLLSFSHHSQFSSGIFPNTWSSLVSPAGPLLGPAQHLWNLRSLLQLSPGLGAPGSPLAAFPLSKACRLWLKVAGMVMVSQDQRCSSAPACLQLSPSSRCSCSIPSEARPRPSTGLCRDLSAFLQPWPGGDRLNSYSECIYSKQTPLACCCLMHIPAAPTVHLIKN